MERILIGHILFEDKDRPYFDLISNFSLTWELLLFYLAASSVIFLCLSLLVTLARRVGSPAYDGTATKSVFHNSLAMLKYFICEKQSLSSIEVFLLMLNVYIWLNQLFIGNNIKTEKVVSLESEQCSRLQGDGFNQEHHSAGGRHKRDYQKSPRSFWDEKSGLLLEG